ncbi:MULTISPECIES: DUF3343 domain-containing protein [unclassified Halanaerobium]|uniref:DUF3343 domain-containing protein n=1 Tax=unclassified Halanaerobium TaxID=2641197 RepID=UPI000E12DCF8|nr:MULTISPECIES: DUF3343 domain-containing protein [unclassified Halanaerobium]RCW45410.1 uncharacterized protein DUF3343 [Halanaerobium sp. MA284_MarDTE_T2]RCW82588.1 uncharacterized protein DUF3343 [Halanaerobium sp. DL-01]
MVEKNKYYLLVFQSTHHSIKAEKIFSSENISYRIVPVPPEITADCGSAVRFNENLKDVLQLMKKNNVVIEEVYEVTAENENKRYNKIYI